MPREALEMEVASVTLEVPEVKTVRLQWPAGHEPDFKTGQFITCYWPDEPNYKRAYSLSSSALDRGHFEVTVKREGKMGTRIVDWAKEGDHMGVIPPTGRFLPVFEPGKHLICIAGGSGVTPFRGFVRDASANYPETQITILYSVRTTNDIIFNAEFRELAQVNPNFNFYVTCTRLHPADPWTGRRGRIDPAWVKQHLHDLPNSVFYACGPNELVEAIEELVLHDLQVPKEQLRTEK